MNVNKIITARHPKNFSNVTLMVSGHRDVYCVSPNGGDTDFSFVTLEVMTVDEAKAAIAAAARIEAWDTYVDTETGMEVIRCVTSHADVKHYMKRRYDILYKWMVDDMIAEIGETFSDG